MMWWQISGGSLGLVDIVNAGLVLVDGDVALALEMPPERHPFATSDLLPSTMSRRGRRGLLILPYSQPGGLLR